MYAMNASLSHSTAYVYGQFYTLSNAPLKQPDSFTAMTTDLGTTFTWTDAVFPKNGATRAGYALLYSTSIAALPQIENGKALDGSEHILRFASVKLPSRPSKNLQIHSLSKDSTYYFMLVPYTWDGSHDST